MKQDLVRFIAAIGFFCLTACGGRASNGTSTSDGDASATVVKELVKFDKGLVWWVAVNDHGIYWIDYGRKGIFAIDRDGSQKRQLNDDIIPDSLAATSDRLLWRSYVDESLAEMRVVTSLDDGTDRRDLFTAGVNEVGTWLDTSWKVPTDGESAFFRIVTNGSQHILRAPLSGATAEVVLEVPAGPIIQTNWVASGNLYYSDKTGIHELNLVTKVESLLFAREYVVESPVFIDDSLYFVGTDGETTSLSGVFRVVGGELERVGPVDIKASTTSIVGEGQFLYILDGDETSQNARVLRFDTLTSEVVTVHEFPGETSNSNLVLDGDYLVFALDTRLVRVLKDPSQLH